MHILRKKAHFNGFAASHALSKKWACVAASRGYYQLFLLVFLWFEKCKGIHIGIQGKHSKIQQILSNLDSHIPSPLNGNPNAEAYANIFEEMKDARTTADYLEEESDPVEVQRLLVRQSSFVKFLEKELSDAGY